MKNFGIVLIILAAGCGFAAFMQTNETAGESREREYISNMEGIRAKQEALENLSRSLGINPESINSGGSRGTAQSIATSRQGLDRSGSERNQKMMLWFGAAGICFLAGIICLAAGGKTQYPKIQT